MANGIQSRLDEVEARLEVAEAELIYASTLVKSIHDDMAEVIQFVRFVKAGGKAAGTIYRVGKGVYYLGKIMLIVSIPIGIMAGWFSEWWTKLVEIFKVFR